MIDFDWTWIQTVNAWQSVATIAVIIIALFIIARFLIKFWPWLKKVITLFDALGRLPPFITEMEKSVADIRHEVKFNNGSSVKDAIARVEVGLSELHKKVDSYQSAAKSSTPRKPRVKKEQ